MSTANRKEYLVTHAEQVGQILRGVRRETGLTQDQAGQRAGLAQKEISKIETSGERTSVERLFRLLSALKLEIVIRHRDDSIGPEDGW